LVLDCFEDFIKISASMHLMTLDRCLQLLETDIADRSR